MLPLPMNAFDAENKLVKAQANTLVKSEARSIAARQGSQTSSEHYRTVFETQRYAVDSILVSLSS